MAEKNRYGQYFTISLIADFMVSLIEHSKSSKVLEPSCGKGVFLDHLVENGVLLVVIQKKQGAPSAKKLMTKIYGNCEILARDKGYYILMSKNN